MKQIYLKSLLLMLMMCVGMGAWGEEETYNFASFTSGQDVELNATNFTITLHKRTGGTNPQWASNQARVYANGSLEISSQKTITKIVYSYAINANNKGKVPSIDGVAGSTNAGSWNSETKTWTGNDTDVTLSTSGEAGNLGFTSVTVTYENAAGMENATLSWSAATATVTIDADDNVFPTLTTTPVGLTGVTYSSSNAEAATINATTGAITLIGAGATTITASYAGDATHYAAADVSYDLTVKAAPVVDGYTHDALTNADFAATSTTYTDFSNVNKNTAVYAGNSSKNNGIQLRSSNSNSGIVSTTSGGKIKKVVVTWNSNCASGRTLDIYGKNTAYTAASNLYSNTTQGTKIGSIVMGTSTELTVTGDYVYVGVRSNSGALNIDEIEFVWDGTATVIPLNAACTDGEFVYGTYSNSSAWVVPENLIVSEISIVDGALYVESYKTSDVVPANTGVMVAAEKGGDYTVEIETDAELIEAAESVLGSDNCLRPSLNGITAEQMADADANCMYYRLTMHNGTQIGYWWGAEEGGAFNLAANKAYLAVPNSASVKSNFWFGGETAISAPVVKMENEMIYNLNGQRVSSATKGLYIKNGKKYFVK